MLLARPLKHETTRQVCDRENAIYGDSNMFGIAMVTATEVAELGGSLLLIYYGRPSRCHLH
jgi:hypothetical protein